MCNDVWSVNSERRRVGPRIPELVGLVRTPAPIDLYCFHEK